MDEADFATPESWVTGQIFCRGIGKPSCSRLFWKQKIAGANPASPTILIFDSLHVWACQTPPRVVRGTASRTSASGVGALTNRRPDFNWRLTECIRSGLRNRRPKGIESPSLSSPTNFQRAVRLSEKTLRFYRREAGSIPARHSSLCILHLTHGLF